MRTEPYLSQLRSLLPAGWSLAFSAADSRSRGPDGALRLTAPDGAVASLLVEMKARLGARQASEIARALTGRQFGNTPADGSIVFAPYVGAMSRQRLREARISYVDLTGNVWVSIDRPAVFLDRLGLGKDPNPPLGGVRSLKGPKAARVVRALSDFSPPCRVGELARLTSVNAGYVTRVLALLNDEDLIRRGDAGEVMEVRWADLLRRWAMDYSVTKTNRALPCVAPRGLTRLRETLTQVDVRYAITGASAVPGEAQIVSGGIFLCYVDEPEAMTAPLDLTLAESGANVLLLEPFDEVVFARTREVLGAVSVALPQCAVDLLTGPGRDPAQGDGLLTWMAENERDWRA